MNLTRNGKIARLPRSVRRELHRRLGNGEQGKKLISPLNALPEVQAIAAAVFDGKAIREQNLSEWKQGGYRDWLAQQEALEVTARLGEDATEWKAEGRTLPNGYAGVLAGGSLCRGDAALAETGGREGWILLREMCGDIIERRKGDHSAERLKIERERLELEKDRTEKRTRETLEEFLNHPETKERSLRRRSDSGIYRGGEQHFWQLAEALQLTWFALFDLATATGIREIDARVAFDLQRGD